MTEIKARRCPMPHNRSNRPFDDRLWPYESNRENNIMVPKNDFDAEMNRKSMKVVNDLAAESGAKVWISHDVVLAVRFVGSQPTARRLKPGPRIDP